MRDALLGAAMAMSALAAANNSMAAEREASSDEMRLWLVGCWQSLTAEEIAGGERDPYAHFNVLCFDLEGRLALREIGRGPPIEGGGSYALESDLLTVDNTDGRGWPWAERRLSCTVHVRSDEYVILSGCSANQDLPAVPNEMVLRRPVSIDLARASIVAPTEWQQLSGCWSSLEIDRKTLANPDVTMWSSYCFEGPDTVRSTSGQAGGRSPGELLAGGDDYALDNGRLVIGRDLDCAVFIEANVRLSLRDRVSNAQHETDLYRVRD